MRVNTVKQVQVEKGLLKEIKPEKTPVKKEEDKKEFGDDEKMESENQCSKEINLAETKEQEELPEQIINI